MFILNSEFQVNYFSIFHGMVLEYMMHEIYILLFMTCLGAIVGVCTKVWKKNLALRCKEVCKLDQNKLLIMEFYVDFYVNGM